MDACREKREEEKRIRVASVVEERIALFKGVVPSSKLLMDQALRRRCLE
jgi:hypothetical protein